MKSVEIAGVEVICLLRFNPDGTRLVTAGHGHARPAVVWDTGDGRRCGELRTREPGGPRRSSCRMVAQSPHVRS